ncbi:MAG TPA: hypothetical protein VEF34_12910, partial [Syntrophobacteraceae bacterium]|nr:hypothetical protein [Syntrophobacteraceae bacterium]
MSLREIADGKEPPSAPARLASATAAYAKIIHMWERAEEHPPEAPVLVTDAQAKFIEAMMSSLSALGSIPDLPPSTRAQFARIHEWSSKSKDRLLGLLTTERRLARFLNSVHGDVQEGLCGAYYHLSSIEAVERGALDYLREA